MSRYPGYRPGHLDEERVIPPLPARKTLGELANPIHFERTLPSAYRRANPTAAADRFQSKYFWGGRIGWSCDFIKPQSLFSPRVTRPPSLDLTLKAYLGEEQRITYVFILSVMHTGTSVVPKTAHLTIVYRSDLVIMRGFLSSGGVKQ